MKKDKISIIIPVYNVEKYLKKCINSVINQTYNNLEIILVDDGSTDDSGLICDLYKKKDDRIIVVHKSNGGLSDARNAGLNIFTGSYVMFVDSDDWIELDCVEYLYMLIKKFNANVARGELFRITDNNVILNKPQNDNKEYLFCGESAMIKLLEANQITTSVCGSLFQRELFLTRRFPYKKLYEDIPVTFDIFLSDAKIAFGAKALYYYFSRIGSISQSTFNINRLDAIEFEEKAIKDTLIKFPQLKELADLRLFFAYFEVFQLLDDSANSKLIKNDICNNIKKYRKTVLLSSRCNFILKVKAICSFFGTKFSNFICTKYRNK